MKLHPRTLPVQQATNEINSAVITLVDRHGLTNVEAIGVMLSIAQQFNRYELRYERHRDSDKKADEE